MSIILREVENICSRDGLMHKDDRGHEGAQEETGEAPDGEQDREAFEAPGGRVGELFELFLDFLHFIIYYNEVRAAV